MPVGGGLDDEQLRLAVQLGADDEQLGIGTADDAGLHAVQDVAVALLLGLGRRGGRVEEGRRLGEGERRGRDLVAGERGEVGGLLLVGAPQGQRGRDGARGQRGHGQAHVALAEGLVDEGAGHRRALGGDAAEVLGHPEDRQPDLEGGLEQLVGRRRRPRWRRLPRVGPSPRRTRRPRRRASARPRRGSGRTGPCSSRPAPGCRGWPCRRGRRCDRRCPRCGSRHWSPGRRVCSLALRRPSVSSRSLEASLFRAATARPIGSRFSLSESPWRPPARSRLQGSFCGSLAVFEDIRRNVTVSYTQRHTSGHVSPLTPGPS